MNSEQERTDKNTVLNERFSTLRTEIDQVDSELLALLVKRVNIVLEVAAIKGELGLEVFDPEREKVILDKIKGKLATHIDKSWATEEILSVFELILTVSKNLQREQLRRE